MTTWTNYNPPSGFVDLGPGNYASFGDHIGHWAEDENGAVLKDIQAMANDPSSTAAVSNVFTDSQTADADAVVIEGDFCQQRSRLGSHTSPASGSRCGACSRRDSGTTSGEGLVSFAFSQTPPARKPPALTPYLKALRHTVKPDRDHAAGAQCGTPPGNLPQGAERGCRIAGRSPCVREPHASV